MAKLSAIYKTRIFTLEDVMREMKLSNAGALSALARWQKEGLIKPVRRNMYVATDLTTDAPIVDKYELASNISETSYVGWHTALEFHGLAHQPFYNAYVGSRSRFNDFHFEHISYEYCAAPLEPTPDNGVIRPNGNPYVSVTDIERTIIDCCDRIDRAGGIEELLHCLEGVTHLNENKLEQYLQTYNKAFLYQKAGFILELQNNVSGTFIEMCRTRGALHTKRLTSTGDSDTYIHKWKLYVPKLCISNNSPYGHELI